MTVPQERPVDAHVHFWDPDRFDYPWLRSAAALHRPFLPGQLAREDPAGAVYVFVQADCLPGQSAAEVEWVRGLRDGGAPIVAAVAHAPLEEGPAVGPRLSELASIPPVAGVRRLLQDEPEGFALRPGFLAGVELLARTGRPLDLCIRSHQLGEVTELVRRRPAASFVLDHLGNPEVSAQALTPWSRDLRKLAELPNVTCKLSGLVTEASGDRRTPAHLVPFLREAVDLFGPGRCMFGSDWPVVTTAMPYAQWLAVVREAIGDLTAGEQAQVMGGTARAVYGIGGRSGPSPPG